MQTISKNDGNICEDLGVRQLCPDKRETKYDNDFLS